MSLGDITVKLTADISEFITNLDLASSRLSDFKNNYSDSGNVSGLINLMNDSEWIVTWSSGLLDVTGALLIFTGAILVACGYSAGLTGILGIFLSEFLIPIAIILAADIAIISVFIAYLLALAGAFIYLWNTNEGFRTAMLDVWNNISLAISGSLEELIPYINSIIKDLKTIVAAIMPIIKPIFDGLMLYIAFVFTYIANSVLGSLKNILLYVTTYVRLVSDVIGFFADAIRGNWEGAFNHLVDFYVARIDFIIGILKNQAETIGNIISGCIETAVGAIGSRVVDKIKPVIDWINGLIDEAKKYGINIDKINLPGNSSKTNKPAMMADGGIVTLPTLSIVGESGPEAVIPLSNLRSLLGNNGGRTITVEVPVYLDSDKIGEVLTRQIRLREGI